ncbi:MAG TPA: NUDIX domain-containing protein, partial [Pseudohaliea sp.]|nr:NUDIX domain-containing protein [Pseudohaliea sp.]
LGGHDRLACPGPGCGFVFWDNPVPVVAAIVERDTGDVVLARNAGWPEGKFGLVTGFLEPAETPEQGVLREVAEEINLPGEIRGFVGLYPFYRNNQLLLVYHVAVSGEPRPGEELAEIRSIPPERLRTWPFGTGPALRDWLLARGYEPRPRQ